MKGISERLSGGASREDASKREKGVESLNGVVPLSREAPKSLNGKAEQALHCQYSTA
jgi:hypothetical protein